MSVTPDSLSITLNTSIPGKQSEKLKYNMLNRNANDKDSKIQFNPLIKLNQKVINRVPEDIRIKQFFNKKRK